MDAIAWYRGGGDDRHVALIWQEGERSDYFVHAHTNTAGVEISEEIYRQLSDTRRRPAQELVARVRAEVPRDRGPGPAVADRRAHRPPGALG